MIFETEHKFQDKLVELLRNRNCYVRCIVGNTLSAGMPDLMIINQINTMFFAELKHIKTKSPPQSLTYLLDGPQKRIIPEEFWGRGQFTPIIACHLHSDYIYIQLKEQCRILENINILANKLAITGPHDLL